FSILCQNTSHDNKNLSGFTAWPDITKYKRHKLHSAFLLSGNGGCFFVTPFPGSISSSNL
ncbi:hypothetical protein E8Y33_RS29415, partial [Escherichia coli]